MLAQDPWPQVSESSVTLLRRFHVAEDSSGETPAGYQRLAWPFVHAVLLRRLGDFGTERSEEETRVDSRILAGLLAIAGPARLAERVISVHSTRHLLIGALLRLFSLTPRSLTPGFAAVSADPTALSDSSTDFPLFPRRHPDFAFLTTDEVCLLLFRVPSRSFHTPSTPPLRPTRLSLAFRASWAARAHSHTHPLSRRSLVRPTEGTRPTQ